jgi:predicted dehydrogenase
MARLDELEEAVQQNHCRVLVGFQFRFHPGLQQVKRVLGEGAIGKPVSASAHWGEFLPGWHPWEDYKQGYAARPELGGGVVLTLSHPLDYLRWLLGEVKAIAAFTSRQGLNLPVEDTAEIALRFNSGALGSIHLDYIQRPAAHWLEIIGTQGSIRWDNSDGIVRLTRIGESENELSRQEIHPPEGYERNWMFLDELRQFRELVNGTTEPLCTLQDGIQALRLSLSALASSQKVN